MEDDKRQQGIITLAYDGWLSEILKRKSYSFTIATDNMRETRIELPEELRQINVFAYAKVLASKLAWVRCLQRLGFYLVDTAITLNKPRNGERPLHNNCLVRFAEPGDKEAVMAVARDNFTYSRFHSDSEFPKWLADNLKAQWAGNYFSGQRGEQMVVACVKGDPVGFLQIIYGKNREFIIDLIAVDHAHRRKGIAEDMITFAEQRNGDADFDEVRVGTQLANIPSLRLYEKLGFKICEAQYVLHFHGGRL